MHALSVQGATIGHGSYSTKMRLNHRFEADAAHRRRSTESVSRRTVKCGTDCEAKFDTCPSAT
jgi:hypothetical protein